MTEQISPPDTPNPFDDLESNPFDNLTAPLSSVRAPLLEQLREDPNIIGKLFSLTHREVGSQGEEAQQAFLETVFNRAAARGQSLAQTVDDSSYYPRISRTPARLSDDDITRYGNLLVGVADGSNVSNFATGNASGRVGFNHGVETSAFGGERFGVEGPDIPAVKVFVQGNPEASQLSQSTGDSNPFDDLSPASVAQGSPQPSPEPLPAPSPAEDQEEVARTALDNSSYAENAAGAAFDIAKGMVQGIPRMPVQTAKDVSTFLDLTHGDPRQRVGAATKILSSAVLQAHELFNGLNSPVGSKDFDKSVLTIASNIAMAKSATKIPKPAPANPSAVLTGGVKGSGKFRAAYQIDKELGDMLEGIGASRESGAYRAEMHLRNMLDGLNKTQESDLGRYLVSKRLEQLNPTHTQVLPASEMTRIASDPAIKHALDYYTKEVKPEIESYRLQAGLQPQQAMAQGPEFISLLPSDYATPPKQGMFRTARTLPRKTPFAKSAKGYAKDYVTDVRKVIERSYGDVIQKVRVNNFYKAAHQKGLAIHQTISTPQGPRKVLNFEGLDPELQEQLTAATQSKIKETGLREGVRKAQRVATSISLTANPAEIQNHMRRQLHILAAKPPIGRGLLARLEWLLPYIGPKTGAFIRTVMDDMSKAENANVLRDIIDAGGGSSRSFSNMYELKGNLAKWTGLKSLQKLTHKLLFGIPKGRGVGGWDLRMRVQLEKIRRAAEGNLDPQRTREFANQIGQYGRHPDWIIGALKELNPYAATSLPMRLTELKQLVGISGLKSKNMATRLFRNFETQLRGTGGTILALTAANKLLSGRWPWENDPGHEFDLRTGLNGKDGRPIYLKLRVIGPELSRPVQTIGIPNLLRERTAEHPSYLAALATALGNQGLAIVGGPLQNALLTATTGKVPYAVKAPGKAPDLMDVAKTEEGQSRGVEQVKRAAAGLNPLADAMLPPRYEPQLPKALELLERPVAGFHGIRPFGSMFTEAYEKKKSKPQTASQKAATLRRKLKRKATQQ